MADKIARRRALDWWHEHLDTGDAVDIKTLSREATAELSADPEFCAAFVADFLEPAMYDMGQRVLATRRAELRTTPGLRRQVEEDAKREGRKWDRWLEYEPETGTYIPLLNMTREQVLAAMSYRSALAEQNAHEARWLKRLASEMRPGQIVGDVLSDERINELRGAAPQRIRKAV